MNSQEHNEGGTPSSQVDLLSVEFKLNLIRRQKEKIAAIEAENKELAAKDAAWKEEIKARCSKMKEIKKEIKSNKIEISKLETTRDDKRQVAKDLDDHIQLARDDLTKYCEENVALAKEQRQAIEDMERKWKIFQSGYEILPLAAVRTEEKTKLQMAKIEFMVKKQTLAEMKEIIRLRQAIEEKRRNDIAIECAELYRESKMNDIKMRVAIMTHKRLGETLRQQEKTLAELQKKHKEQLAAPQQSVEKKSCEISIFTPSQKRLTSIPRFDLSFARGTVTQQPISNLTRDLDSISITSSVIDNLIEPKNIQPTDDNEHDHQDQAQAEDANISDSNSIANDAEEDPGITVRVQSDPDPCVKDAIQDDEEAEFEEFQAPVDEQQKTEETCPPKASQEELGDKRNGEIVESEYWPATPREKTQEERITAQSCPSEIKRPRISKTEKVQLQLTPRNIESSKPSRDDSLATYFDTSAGPSANYSWKANHPSSFMSYADSQRGNVESESGLVSETSMQSEDFMKKFRFSFSPERGDGEASARPIDDEKNRYATPQTTGAAPFQIGVEQRAPQGFLDFGTSETPTSRGNKKEGFFLNLF